MNSRKYPRTMNEAFPFGPEYGCSITRYEKLDGHNYIVGACLLCAVIVTVLIAMGVIV